jgi:hypothetical protein
MVFLLNIFRSGNRWYWQVMQAEQATKPYGHFSWYYGDRCDLQDSGTLGQYGWYTCKDALIDWHETARFFNVKWQWMDKDDCK